MADAITKRMLRALEISAPAPMFLTTLFQSPQENFHNSHEVEYDVERSGADIAVVVQDLTAGSRENEFSKYTNKKLVPPVFSESATIVAHDLMDRQVGQNPYIDPDFQTNAMLRARKLVDKLGKKIGRAIEGMASQILQTGKLDLKNDAGATLYTIDFKPKAAHMATVSATWAQDGSTGTPLADLEALARTVLRNSSRMPTDLIFGANAWRAFKANAKVKDMLNFRRANLIDLPRPTSSATGAQYLGEMVCNTFAFRGWTYEGYYLDPQTGNPTAYVDPDYVLMRGEGARLDLTFGGVPIIAQDQAAIRYLPRRVSLPERRMDVFTNAYLERGGRQLKIEATSRPCTIPTEIDSFARLDTTV